MLEYASYFSNARSPRRHDDAPSPNCRIAAIALIDAPRKCMRVKASVGRYDSLDALMSAFPALASAAPEADVFESAQWFNTLQMSGFSSPPEVAWLLARDDFTSTLFATPLLPDLAHATALSSFSNFYSSLYGVIGNCNAASEALWRAVGLALRDLPNSGVSRLQPLARDGAFYRGMAAGLARAGFLVDTYFCFGNWYLPLNGQAFAAFFAALPSPLRNSIERGRRRLQREGEWNVEIYIAKDHCLDAVVAEFEAVYHQSWKEPEPCPRFMPGLIRMAAAEGWLRLGVLRLGGQPIAAQVWLVKDGKANIYKLAYVKGFDRFSPGSVLTAALMQHAIDVDQVHEIDYLTGDDAYKRDWMSHRRERVGLVAFDPLTLRGLAGAARHFGGRWLKKLKSRLRSTAA